MRVIKIKHEISAIVSNVSDLVALTTDLHAMMKPKEEASLADTGIIETCEQPSLAKLVKLAETSSITYIK